MPDPRFPPRTPQIPPRGGQQRAAPQAQRPGRDARQPYINHHANLGALAKHMLIGIDKSQITTTVKTHELVGLLEQVIALGFGNAATEKMASTLYAAYQGAMAANEKQATE